MLSNERTEIADWRGATLTAGTLMTEVSFVEADAFVHDLDGVYGLTAIVVDHAGAPLGALRSPSQLSASRDAAHALARDLMVPVLTVDEREPILRVIGRMAAERARVACVVADDGTAVGIVTDVAALQGLARGRDYAH